MSLLIIIENIINLSPILINNGTFTTAPVDKVAGFVPPPDVSPLRPGSVSVTSRIT